MQLTESFTHCV